MIGRAQNNYIYIIFKDIVFYCIMLHPWNGKQQSQVIFSSEFLLKLAENSETKAMDLRLVDRYFADQWKNDYNILLNTHYKMGKQ